MNKWEELCRLLQPLLGRDVPEAVFQDSFVLHLEDIFGWGGGSIEQQRRIRIGATDKRMDIVLSGIDFGIVIEMKRPCDRRDSGDVEQLNSYLFNIGEDKYKYGLLVGKEVTVVYYDKLTNKKPIEVITFSFESNNQYGMKLGEILDKNVCSDEKLKKYVDEVFIRGEDKKRQEKLKNELLADNGKQAKEWIKSGYDGNDYTNEDFDMVFEGIEIKAKGNGGGGGINPTTQETQTNRDKFREYLEKTEKKVNGVIAGYCAAINRISRNYLEKEGLNIDIYRMTDLPSLKQINKDLHAGGKYSTFGSSRAGVPMAAMAAYVRFIQANDRRKLIVGDKEYFYDLKNLVDHTDIEELVRTHGVSKIERLLSEHENLCFVKIISGQNIRVFFRYEKKTIGSAIDTIKHIFGNLEKINKDAGELIHKKHPEEDGRGLPLRTLLFYDDFTYFGYFSDFITHTTTAYNTATGTYTWGGTEKDGDKIILWPSRKDIYVKVYKDFTLDEKLEYEWWD